MFLRALISLICLITHCGVASAEARKVMTPNGHETGYYVDDGESTEIKRYQSQARLSGASPNVITPIQPYAPQVNPWTEFNEGMEKLADNLHRQQQHQEIMSQLEKQAEDNKALAIEDQRLRGEQIQILQLLDAMKSHREKRERLMGEDKVRGSTISKAEFLSTLIQGIKYFYEGLDNYLYGYSETIAKPKKIEGEGFIKHLQVHHALHDSQTRFDQYIDLLSGSWCTDEELNQVKKYYMELAAHGSEALENLIYAYSVANFKESIIDHNIATANTKLEMILHSDPSEYNAMLMEALGGVADLRTESLTDNTRYFLQSSSEQDVIKNPLGMRFGLTREGLFVVAVIEGSPADKAGVVSGDVLLALQYDGQEEVVGNLEEYETALRRSGESRPKLLKIDRNGIQLQLALN